MKKLITTLFLLLSSCVTPAPQTNCGFNQNVYGERILWRQFPIKIYIDSSFPENDVPALKEAMKVWEDLAGYRLFDLQDERLFGNKDAKRDGKNVIILGYFDSVSLLGLTTYWNRQDEILEADIKFKPGANTKITMIHELGHLLGLVHNEDEENSIMYTYYYKNQVLTETDINNFKCGYK